MCLYGNFVSLKCFCFCPLLWNIICEKSIKKAEILFMEECFIRRTLDQFNFVSRKFLSFSLFFKFARSMVWYSFRMWNIKTTTVKPYCILACAHVRYSLLQRWVFRSASYCSQSAVGRIWKQKKTCTILDGMVWYWYFMSIHLSEEENIIKPWNGTTTTKTQCKHFSTTIVRICSLPQNQQISANSWLWTSLWWQYVHQFAMQPVM